MISASVAPLARFIIAITSAFLLVRSVFGLLAPFLPPSAFFAALAFLAALPVRLGAASGARLAVGLGIDCVFAHRFSFAASCLRSSHPSLRLKEKASGIFDDYAEVPWRAARIAIGGPGSLFYRPDKTTCYRATIHLLGVHCWAIDCEYNFRDALYPLSLAGSTDHWVAYDLSVRTHRLRRGMARSWVALAHLGARSRG